MHYLAQLLDTCEVCGSFVLASLLGQPRSAAQNAHVRAAQ